MLRSSLPLVSSSTRPFSASASTSSSNYSFPRSIHAPAPTAAASATAAAAAPSASVPRAIFPIPDFDPTQVISTTDARLLKEVPDSTGAIARYYIRRVEYPLVRPVKVPVEVPRIVPTTIAVKVRVPKAVLDRPNGSAHQAETERIAHVPSTRVQMVDAYRVDQVTDTRILEILEKEHVPAPIHGHAVDPSIEREIIEIHDLGRLKDSRLASQLGDTYYSPQDHWVKRVELDTQRDRELLRNFQSKQLQEMKLREQNMNKNNDNNKQEEFKENHNGNMSTSMSMSGGFRTGFGGLNSATAVYPMDSLSQSQSQSLTRTMVKSASTYEILQNPNARLPIAPPPQPALFTSTAPQAAATAVAPVTASPATAWLERFGLALHPTTHTVLGIKSGSPAASSGFQVGDILQTIAGAPMKGISTLFTASQRARGATTIQVQRDHRPKYLHAIM